MFAVDLVRRRINRCGRPRSGDAHILLIEQDAHNRQVVARCCQRSIKAGVFAGMPVAEARALLPLQGLHVEPFDPVRDRDALRALATWAQRFSPLVAVDEPDGLLIDVTGCERVFQSVARASRPCEPDEVVSAAKSSAMIGNRCVCTPALTPHPSPTPPGRGEQDRVPHSDPQGRVCERAVTLDCTAHESAAAKSYTVAQSALTPNPSPKGRGEQEAFTLATASLRPAPSPTPPLGRGEQEGLRNLLNQLHARLTQLKFTNRVAIAPTFACAWAIARFGHTSASMIAQDEVRHTLAPLPVRALRLDDATEIGLAEVGIDRIEHLFDIPRSVLPSRFGHDVLLRLDQALGQAMESIDPVRLLRRPQAHRIFDGPTTQYEAIEITVRELLRELCEQLQSLERGARLIHIDLARIDLAPARLEASLSRPSREASHLWSLIQPRLERVQLGFGVEAITITAVRTGRLAHEQVAWWRDGSRAGHAAIERAAGELIDTLINRLGPRNVQALEPVESHIPEDAVRRRSIVNGASRSGQRGGAAVEVGGAAAGVGGALVAADRPTLLLDRPSPVQAMALSPDGPVLRIRWRGVEEEIVATVGPERIGPQWWRDGEGRTRDYFKARERGGRWLWVFREVETGRWFVHGVWT